MHGDTQHNAKYNSQELDTETGFYFYNARHYDPVICRFVTADSVVDGELSPMGWNRYMYVHGNPVVYLDPTGHWQADGFGHARTGLKNIINYTDENDNAHTAKLYTGTVEKDDTLWSIAKKQIETEIGKKNVTNKLINNRINAIKAVNGLKDNLIKPGQKLVVGFTDRNYGKEGLEKPPFDPIMDGISLFTGAIFGKKVIQESLSKIGAQVIIKQGTKQLVLRKSGKFIKHTTVNLVKGLFKAGSNKTRALLAKELYYKFGATKTAAFISTVTHGLGGAVSPSPPDNKVQAIGATFKKGLEELDNYLKEKSLEKSLGK